MKERTYEVVSNYRWVMAVIAGILVTTSFISLTSFGIATPFIAKSMNIDVTTVSNFGVDSFSIALFVAFFLGSSGFFDTRIKLGVFTAQVFLIVPQFLIPSVHLLWLLTVLRFCQGLVIMILALFSLQLSGWFKPSERAVSLSFTMGAMPLGGAVGGILSSRLLAFGWRWMYYISALLMITGAVTYFIFARNARRFEEEILASKQKPHGSVWNQKLTWIMGLLPTPVAWSLFSMGGFLPSFGYHLGYKTFQVGNLMLIWGIAGAISCFIGALIGDKMVKGKCGNDDIFHARLNIMMLANVLVGVGASIIMFLGPYSFAWLIIGAIINAFSQILAPNYWASLSNIFPIALMGTGAFAMGLLSNIPSAVGPLVSSFIINGIGWPGFFLIMVLLSIFGIFINILAARSKLLT